MNGAVRSARHGALGIALAAMLSAGCADQAAAPARAPDAADSALARRVALLEARATRVEDINAIKRLQRAYGYYLDEGQWDDVADLFSATASVEIGFDGVYRGKERIRTYFRAWGDGRNGLAAGRLNEYLQVMPVITLGGDGQRARGTWRAIVLAAVVVP